MAHVARGGWIGLSARLEPCADETLQRARDTLIHRWPRRASACFCWWPFCSRSRECWRLRACFVSSARSNQPQSRLRITVITMEPSRTMAMRTTMGQASRTGAMIRRTPAAHGAASVRRCAPRRRSRRHRFLSLHSCRPAPGNFLRLRHPVQVPSTAGLNVHHEPSDAV